MVSAGSARLLICLVLPAVVGCAPNLPPVSSRAASAIPPQQASPAPQAESGGGGYYKDDGPPDGSVDLARIPDAVPRHEPLSRTGNNPYEVFGKEYVPLKSARGFEQTGFASWYGKKFHGKRTSSGDPYDMFAMTAAHPTLPLPTWVRVYNHANGRAVVVKVNDRGPFLKNRIIDLSYAAATRLDIVNHGTSRVTIAAVFPAEGAGAEPSDSQAGGSWQYFIQVGAYSERFNAVNMRDRLSLLGFSVYPASNSDIPGRNGLFIVKIGPYASRSEARRALQSVHDKTGQRGMLVWQ